MRPNISRDRIPMQDEQDRPVSPESRPRERSPLRVHMPVDVRNLSLAILAVLAVIYTLHWAKEVFVPVLLALLASYAMSPLVDRMQRLRLPRALSASVLVLGLLAGVGATGYALADDAQDLVNSLPQAARKLGQTIRRGHGADPLDKVQKAADELQRVTTGKASRSSSSNSTSINIKDYLWSSTMQLTALIMQGVATAMLTVFMLASGDTFRRKMVHIAGPTFSRRRITLQVLDDIDDQIQRYLLVQLLISAIVGILTGLAFWGLGLEQAAVWGIAAGLLNLVPYLGAALVTGGAAISALLQFGTIEMALGIAAASIVVRIITGNVLSPWITGRAGRMNPVAIFIGVIAWGWLWGAWGLLLGIPILMIVKAVCDRVDDLAPIGELLGE